MSIVPYEDDGLFLLPFASLPKLKKGEIIMIYPSIEEAKKKYSEYNVFPVVREILSDSFTPIHIFKALKRNEENAFILESVNNGNQWGRYSFIGINPKIEVKINKGTAMLTENGITTEEKISNPVSFLQNIQSFENMNRCK